MRTRRANDVGRFSVEIEVANNDDLAVARRGLLPPEQVRRETITGVVDSGAVRLVLPEAVVKRLGLPLGDPIPVKYADGHRTRRKRVEGVFAQLLGRHGVFTADVEPKRDTALIGASCSKTSTSWWTARIPGSCPAIRVGRSLRSSEESPDGAGSCKAGAPTWPIRPRTSCIRASRRPAGASCSKRGAAMRPSARPPWQRSARSTGIRSMPTSAARAMRPTRPRT
jgi:hypothetical protein